MDDFRGIIYSKVLFPYFSHMLRTPVAYRRIVTLFSLIFLLSVGTTSFASAEVDTDGDGLSDTQESFLGTDPAQADTDGDQLNDGEEVNLLHTDPTLFDTDTDDSLFSDYEVDNDNDGLSNGYEVNDWAPVGTPGNFTGEGGNPNNFDTDEDGLGDLLEASNLACFDITIDNADHDGIKDPDEDCDADGLTNIQEVTMGTSPTAADTDNDGSPDATEVVNNTNPTDPESTPLDPNGDEDNDGLTNSQENVAGTDPYSSDTDQDYYLDGEESGVSDPLSATSTPSTTIDTDGDRVKDSLDKDDDEDKVRDTVEIANGTSPRNADTDGDGVSDRTDAYPLDSTR